MRRFFFLKSFLCSLLFQSLWCADHLGKGQVLLPQKISMSALAADKKLKTTSLEQRILSQFKKGIMSCALHRRPLPQGLSQKTIGAPLEYIAFLESRLITVFKLRAKFITDFMPRQEEVMSIRDRMLHESYFSSFNLSGANLSYRDLSKLDLQGVDFSRAMLYEVDFSKADLSGAYMREVFAVGAKFRGAKLIKTNLFRANLQRANFDDVDLREVNLREANLNKASFDDVDLCGTNLREANLEYASFKFARRKFKRCPFYWSGLEGCKSRWCKFKKY